MFAQFWFKWILDLCLFYSRAQKLFSHRNDSPVISMDGTGDASNQFFFTTDWSGTVKAWSRSEMLAKLQTPNWWVINYNSSNLAAIFRSCRIWSFWSFAHLVWIMCMQYNSNGNKLIFNEKSWLSFILACTTFYLNSSGNKTVLIVFSFEWKTQILCHLPCGLYTL